MRDSHHPMPHRGGGGRPARGAAAHGVRGGGGSRAVIGIGGHASLRPLGGPAHRLAPALPGPHSGPPVRGTPGAHLRNSRARGHRRPGQGHPRGERDAGAPAAAAGPVRQLAVLARRQLGHALHPHTDLPRVPAGRHPAALRRLRGLDAPDRLHGRQQDDLGLHLPLVRRPPASQVRHGRGEGDGLADPPGAHAGPGGARPGDGQGAGGALRVRPGALALSLRDARREQVAGRPARAWRASSWTCRAATACARASWRGAWSTA